MSDISQNGVTEQEGSDDEIEVTASEVLEKLTETWLNEKFSPDLLESRIEYIECMLAQVKELESGFHENDNDFISSIQRIELERVKFVIASILRKRLEKIEQYAIHTLEVEAKSDTPKLSPGELVYAKSFAESLQSHMNGLVLQHMPSNMQTIDPRKTAPRPNLYKYVFMKVRERQEQVLIDPEEEPFDLEVGSQHIVRYKPVEVLIESGAVSLL